MTEELVVTASDELGISRSLVYRLVAKFRKRPQVSSLLPGKRGRKASAHTLSVAAEAVVRDAIANVYQQRDRTPLVETCGVCFIEDPLAITNSPIKDKSLRLASCWNCGSSLLLYDPEPPDGGGNNRLRKRDFDGGFGEIA